MSYGLIHSEQASSSFSQVGVNIVVDGTIASIADIRNDIFGIETVGVSGTVSSAGEPLQSAQIVVYQVLDADANPPALFIVNHSRTDAAGEYKLRVPPSDYQIRANMEGYRFPDGVPSVLVVEADAAVTRNFDMPPSGFLDVTVIDEIGPAPRLRDRIFPVTETTIGRLLTSFRDCRMTPTIMWCRLIILRVTLVAEVWLLTRERRRQNPVQI